MRRWLLLALFFMTFSCAGPRELARRSDTALIGGDPQKAYQLAAKALDKDPGNAEARSAMHAAASAIAEDQKQRIRAVGDVDTVAGARMALEFGDFRAEAARYRAGLAPDTAFATEERTLRSSAARQMTEAGDLHMDQQQPKRAYDDYTEASRFTPGARDLDARLRTSYEQAVTRVAILPFENQTGYPDLTRRYTDYVYSEIARRLRAKEFRFTRLVTPSDLTAVATVAEWNRLAPDDALRIAQRAGAQQVVWGRLYGLNTETRTETFHDHIYRKQIDKDESGATRVRYVEQELTAVTRRRNVNVGYDWQLLDVANGRRLAQYGDRRSVGAQTVYTGFVPQGSISDYALVPPGEYRNEAPERYRSAESQWRAAMPENTELKTVLERSKAHHGRTRYQGSYLSEFYPGANPWVFLDDLPPPDDLAFAALVQEWRPLYDVLKRLESEDAVDVAP